MLNANIFRENEIRGVADRDLAGPDVQALGSALGSYLIRYSGRIVCLGRDARTDSPRLHASLLKGLLSAGVHVLDLGPVPKPVLRYSAVHFTADGAIMIGGSDDAPEEYGFSVVCGADLLSGQSIQDVYKLVQHGDFEAEEGNWKESDAVTPYVEEIASQVEISRPVRVAVDAGTGAAGPVLHRLLRKLKIQPVKTKSDIDSKVPSFDPESAATLKSLRASVKKEKADLGIAIAPDADRIGVIDEHGNAVPPDSLLLLFGREILSRKPGSVFVGDARCSEAVFEKLRELGGNPVRYEPNGAGIRARMKQERAELAAEMSGHLFFADKYYGYEDAIYSACRLLELVSKSGRPLSEDLSEPQRLASAAPVRNA